jgi:uncharacterized protein (DUF302 family)
MHKPATLLLLAALATPVLAQSTQPAPKPMTAEQIAQMQQMQQMMQMQQMRMMSVMFDLRKSRHGFDETLAAIRAGAQKRGWQLGETVDMQAAMRQAGNRQAPRMKVVQLCPAGANDKVAKAGGGKTPPLPCRATVFEDKDGKVHVMRMNLGNLAKTLQGDLAKAMAEVGAEEDALYKGILE